MSNDNYGRTAVPAEKGLKMKVWSGLVVRAGLRFFETRMMRAGRLLSDFRA